jgi:N-acetylglucosamine-6-phosphate deacetylase
MSFEKVTFKLAECDLKKVACHAFNRFGKLSKHAPGSQNSLLKLENFYSSRLISDLIFSSSDVFRILRMMKERKKSNLL